jgi:hypothetical protein
LIFGGADGLDLKMDSTGTQATGDVTQIQHSINLVT